MFSRKSVILRIGKYHVLLLQLSIYYKNNGESGWFNDLLMQELLMMLKEPIQRRLSDKLAKDKKTKQDEVEIGTGTAMKFGFQFVNKEMYQPFVIPENEDDKFRSLCLFEEKLKVTVCPSTASSVEDKATTILLNSSSQFSRETVAISDYFNKCHAVKGLTTESAQKKRCKLKRIVKQGANTSEAQYKNVGGFIPDDGSSGETGKQCCNNGGSWEETKKQRCNDKTQGAYLGNEGRGQMGNVSGEENVEDWDVAKNEDTRETGDRIVAKKRGTIETKGVNATKVAGTALIENENVAKKSDNKETECWNLAKTECKTKTEDRQFAEKADKANIGVCNIAIKECATEAQVENLPKNEVLNVATKKSTTKIEVLNELKEGFSTDTGLDDRNNVCKVGLSDGSNGDVQDKNNGGLSTFKKEDTTEIVQDLNVVQDGRIYVNDEYVIESGGIRENLILSNDSDTAKEYGSCNRKHKSRNNVQRVTDFNQSNDQDGLTLPENMTNCSKQYKGNVFKPETTVDSKKKKVEIIRKYNNQVEAGKIVKGETKDNCRQCEKLLSGGTGEEKPLQCRRYGSALSELTSTSTSTRMLLDEESKPPINTNSCDDKKSHFTGIKNKTLQKRGQRSKLSLKRQNKDNLKAIERAPKKAKRSMSFDLLITDDITHKENVSKEIVETTACSTEINLTRTEKAGAIHSSKTSVNNASIQEQETHRQSHEVVDEVRTVDSLSCRSPVEQNMIYQNQLFMKVIETEKDKVTAPEVYTCQSDDEGSDTDLFMNNTEQEDSNIDLLSDLSDDSWIIGSSTSAQRISKPSEQMSRSPHNELSTSNRLRRISEKMCMRFERDASLPNNESDSRSSPLADEYREYCSSPIGDSDFPEVCVNEQFDVIEVGSVKEDTDVEIVTSSDYEAGQIRFSNTSNQKQDEIAMSPELISDDDQDDIISKNGYHSLKEEANIVKQPQEFTSNTLMDLTTEDTSGDELPCVSFSTHQLHTSQHQSKDQVVILDGTKQAANNLNSPEPISPVFGKRKMCMDQTSAKCIRLNYDFEDTTLSNDPVQVPISKKSKFKFKMRDKSQTTSRPVENIENSESKTNKENVFANDADSRYQLKPRKRFSQLWVKNINQTCSKKKKNLFSFGITGCKKDEERKDAKEIETINLLDDDYESELDKSVLKVRNIDELNLEAIAFIVWKNQQYLTDIFQGKSHFSVRHENYKKGGVKKADLDFKVPLHMFSDEQVETVVEILVKIFCSKGTKYWDYVMKVLLAEALIKIYMDIHHIDYNEAQEIIENMKNSQEYLK